MDYVDLPDWGLTTIEAKIDTGAYGCALHCHHVEVVDREGVPTLRFKLLDPDHPEYNDHYLHATKYSQKKVRSSSGQVEHRYSVKTKLRLFGRSFQTEFSLTDRQQMRYPVLIGRKFLNKRFLVDVSQKDLSFNQLTVK
jgi:hypothetical protein